MAPACLARFFKDEVDLRRLEPGQFDVDVEFDQPLQFDRQELFVPAGPLGELVVGKDIGALLGLAQMRQPAGRYSVDDLAAWPLQPARDPR